jgi:hypothetical protein
VPADSYASPPRELAASTAQQRRFDTQSSPAVPQLADSSADIDSAPEAAAPPKKRLTRRLTTQSLDVPLSRLAGGESPSPAHGTPRGAEPSGSRERSPAQAALRQSAPGDMRDAEGEAAPGSRHGAAGGKRLLRGMPERGGTAGSTFDERLLASRSTDARSGRGGSVFGQQLAALRSSMPSGKHLEDAR